MLDLSPIQLAITEPLKHAFIYLRTSFLLTMIKIEKQLLSDTHDKLEINLTNMNNVKELRSQQFMPSTLDN